MKPLIYLEFRQLVNSIKNTLRSPKRLIPTLIIAAWIASWFVQSLLIVSGAAPQVRPGLPQVTSLEKLPMEMIKAVTFLLLSFGSMVVVFQAFSSGLLVFSIAHIDFLFPAPISRRKVLLVKLIKDYIKYGLWVAFFVLFVGVPVLGSLKIPIWPMGLYSIAALTAMLLFVVNVAHTVNLVFTFGFERLRQAGTAIKLVLVAGLASAVVYGAWQYALTGDSYASVLWALDSPVVNTVFAPARWTSVLLLAPMFKVFPEDYLHLALLWALAAGTFLLLMSRRENVYEPSLGISVKYDRRRQAMRSGDYSGLRLDAMVEKGTKSAPGLSIPPFGKGATALLWKNLLAKYRMSRVQMLLMLVMPALVVFLIRRFVDEEEVRRNLPFLLPYMAFILSMVAQPEVRAELKHANLLKPMPIAAWKVILVQALSAAIYLGLGVAAFGLSIYLIVPDARGDLLVASVIGSPFVGFAAVACTIIPSLLYPDTRDAAQNYICNMVGFLLVSVAAIPTVVIGVVLVAMANVSYYYVVPIICAANIIVGAAAVSVAGSIFSRFDPTGE